MKKYIMAVILCGLITAFAGCRDQENMDSSRKITGSESSFTTSATTSVSATEATTVKETAETSSKVESSATEISQGTAASTAKETQAPTASTAPQTKPVITEQVTTPQTKPIVTESPKPVVTSAPQTEKPAATTAVPKPQKVLNEAFKQELTAYIQNYCKEVGLVYSDDGNTPDNSSWDIPVRTLYGESNVDIIQRVKNGARIILINYGVGTVINLYFEDDWEQGLPQCDTTMLSRKYIYILFIAEKRNLLLLYTVLIFIFLLIMRRFS